MAEILARGWGGGGGGWGELCKSLGGVDLIVDHVQFDHLMFVILNPYSRLGTRNPRPALSQASYFPY